MMFGISPLPIHSFELVLRGAREKGLVVHWFLWEVKVTSLLWEVRATQKIQQMVVACFSASALWHLLQLT